MRRKEIHSGTFDRVNPTPSTFGGDADAKKRNPLRYLWCLQTGRRCIDLRGRRAWRTGELHLLCAEQGTISGSLISGSKRIANTASSITASTIIRDASARISGKQWISADGKFTYQRSQNDLIVTIKYMNEKEWRMVA